MKILTLALLLLVTFGTVKGQKIEGYSFNAIYIPSEIINSISIDGNLADWYWVPDSYKLNTSNLLNSDQITPDDFDVEFFVAWSKITNNIYIVCKIIDDSLNVDHIHPDDGLEINLNSNNISGEYWSGSNYKMIFFNVFFVSIPAIGDINDVVMFYGPNWMLKNNEYFHFSNKVTKLKNGKTVMIYEVSLQPCINLALFSKTLSSKSLLKEGDILGLTLAFNDVDYKKNERDVQLRTVSGRNFWHQAEESTSLILDPPMKTSNIYDKLLFLSSDD